MTAEVPHHGEDNKDQPIIDPTPLEAAFSTELGALFKATLSPSVVDAKNQCLRRGTRPISVGNKIAVFEYTRKDVFYDFDYAMAAFKQTHPNSHYIDDATKFNEPRYAVTNAEWGNLSNEADEMIAIEERIKELATIRHGELSQLDALTDPAYYLPQTPVEQWPETFSCAIFPQDTMPSLRNTTTRIGPSGRVNGQLPDTHVSLNMQLRLRHILRPFNLPREGMTVDFPKQRQSVARAYGIGYEKYKLKNGEVSGMKVEDIVWFPGFLHQHQISSIATLGQSPREMMHKFGRFLFLLGHSK